MKFLCVSLFIGLYCLLVIRWITSKQKVYEYIQKRQHLLTYESYVLRDGIYHVINSADVVPGDRILLKSGSYVSADCKLIDTEEKKGCLVVDQRTNEDIIIQKKLYAGDYVRQGNLVREGQMQGIVITQQETRGTKATTTTSYEYLECEKLLYKVLFGAGILFFWLNGICFLNLLNSDIPILDAIIYCCVIMLLALPTDVMWNVKGMLLKNAYEQSNNDCIISRLSAIEKLVHINTICFDKTGVLTTGHMELFDELPIFTSNIKRDEVLATAALATEWKEIPENPIDKLVLNAIDLRPLNVYKLLEHKGFHSYMRRSESLIENTKTKEMLLVTKGDPDVIVTMCKTISEETRSAIQSKIECFSKGGIRCLGVARSKLKSLEDQPEWQFLGLIAFTDSIRFGTCEAIQKADECGISSILLTSDQVGIAKYTCQQCGLGDEITQLAGFGENYNIEALLSCVDGVALISPEQKAFCIQQLKRKHKFIAMLGSTPRDIDAVREADVGIARANSCDTIRSFADVILKEDGIKSVVLTILNARRVFIHAISYIVASLVPSFHIASFLIFAVLFVHPNDCQYRHFIPFPPLTCPPNNSKTIDSTIVAESVPSHFMLSIPCLCLLLFFGYISRMITIYFTTSASPRHIEIWNTKRLAYVSLPFCSLLILSTFTLLYCGLDSWNPSGLFHLLGIKNLSYPQIQVMIFLQLVMFQPFYYFSVGIIDFYCRDISSNKKMLLFAFIEVCLANLLCLLWPFALTDGERLPIQLVGFLWIYAIFWGTLHVVFRSYITKFLNNINGCKIRRSMYARLSSKESTQKYGYDRKQFHTSSYGSILP